MLKQKSIFPINRISDSPTGTGYDDLLKESHFIVDRAIKNENPYAVCLMLSGGDDSVTALHVALMLGIKIDFIIHGVTGTGLSCVRPYVKSLAEKHNIKIIYADAGTAFEDYVTRKGFFGRGKSAHVFSYHVLKNGPFESAIARNITKRVARRKIILLNGVRVEESENRADNYGDDPYTYRKNLIWVNIIHWWTKKGCLHLLESENIQRNPASIELKRSGECNCGTMQSLADIQAASEFDPQFREWMTSLRQNVVRKFGWDICQQPSKKQVQEVKDSASNLSEFMPMCVGCKSKQNKLFE
jgi:3'-phosphoadenosine 5'-phosphosulfate sulfotransferase (PAPS reductase)/FAD synthetase